MPSSTKHVSWLAAANRSANLCGRQGRRTRRRRRGGPTRRPASRPASVRCRRRVADRRRRPGSGTRSPRTAPPVRACRLRPSVTTSVACSTNDGQLRPRLVGLGPVAAQAERVGAGARRSSPLAEISTTVSGASAMFVGSVVLDVGNRPCSSARRSRSWIPASLIVRCMHVRQQRAGIDLDLRALLDHPAVAGDEQRRQVRNVVLDGDEAALRSRSAATTSSAPVGMFDAVGAGVVGRRVRWQGGDRRKGLDRRSVRWQRRGRGVVTTRADSPRAMTERWRRGGWECVVS